MAFLKCPKCQKIYNDNNTYYCLKCNQRLVKMENEYNIPTTPQPTSPTITCPYCKSTDCKKISGLSKAGSVALWGIFALGKTTKQWHCNSCKSDF